MPLVKSKTAGKPSKAFETDTDKVISDIYGDKNLQKAELKIRLPQHLKDKLVKASAEEGETINAYVVNLIKADLRRNGYM